MMPKLPPATTKSLGIAFAMIKPDTHMPTVMPTCVHRFLPVRKSTSESGAARPREARGHAKRRGRWLMHCFFAEVIGGFDRVLAEAVVAGRAAHAA